MRRAIHRLVRGLFRLRPAQLIVFAFLLLIALGTLLLSLPVASADGVSCGGLTALFTSTSAVCVTGLVVTVTAEQWSGFGQVVILCLIQIGGLGFMTIVSVFFFLLHRRIGLKQRMLIAQSLSLNDVDGVVRLVRRVLLGTLICEGTGAVLLTVRFCFDTSFPQALAWGIFHSVSAFCNAGFDILGSNSMANYVGDPFVNLVLIALIVVGGLGFFVWDDLIRHRRFRDLSVHTRLVLLMTAVLIGSGTVLFAAIEWNNPATLGPMPVWKKLLAALFQSVTLRTAGFETIPQGAMREASQAVSLLYMFIGGSSGSTAGGAKTVTIAVLFLSVLASMRGRSRVTVFGRSLAEDQLRSALTLVIMMLVLAFGGAVFLSASQDLAFLPCLYETVSALGTVGTTTGLTPLLGAAGRVMIIFYMFFGRVGIMTLSVGFLLGNRAESRYQYAETRVLIG